MNEKFAVYKMTPAIRALGQVCHYHDDKKKPCYCRDGMDATLQQAMSSAPNPPKAEK